MPGPSSCCPWLRLDARGAVGVLTEAALPPVVVGQAVITLGPRGAFFAFTVAGLVAAVVQGADLVAVTFWPKTAPSGLVLPMDFVPAVPLGDAGDLGRAQLRDMGGPWESLHSPGCTRGVQQHKHRYEDHPHPCLSNSCSSNAAESSRKTLFGLCRQEIDGVAGCPNSCHPPGAPRWTHRPLNRSPPHGTRWLERSPMHTFSSSSSAELLR